VIKIPSTPAEEAIIPEPVIEPESVIEPEPEKHI
jgi:hypothetical protein